MRGAQEGDGTLFVEAGITSLVLRGERFWLTMLQDATARRQLEREVLEASNREQQRIGNDLHDGLGQELTGIALLLRGLENRAEREAPALSPSIEEIALLVNDAIFTTRALARGLSPVTFDRGGLALALEELARRLSAMFHINVRCEADDALERGLESVNALHLYRIAQEAVTNAAQHGSAGQVIHRAAFRRRTRPAAHRGQRPRIQSGRAPVQGTGAAHHALPRADDGRQPAHRERAAPAAPSSAAGFRVRADGHSCVADVANYLPRVAIPAAIFWLHSAGPVWCTEVPFASTATVTGMSSTVNS